MLYQVNITARLNQGFTVGACWCGCQPVMAGPVIGALSVSARLTLYELND
jgi:hypothetical protein